MTLPKQKVFIIMLLIVGIAAVAVAMLYMTPKSPAKDNKVKTNPQPTSSPESTPDKSTVPEPYAGKVTAIADAFSVKIPNGWRGSVSSQQSFLAIQFARPLQLESLVYDPTTPPAVDYNGIPAWNGLTEHFYIRKITATSQAFNPSKHAEVVSESFTFDDGTVGQKYSVTKHASEAAAWGGLLKDSEWYGRVFVYKKGDVTVEAHLAYYPSTKIDTSLYEKVARSLHI